MEISKIFKNCLIDSNGCWIWQKSCNSAGYGQLTENKIYWLAHRYAYACVNTDINSADVVRHKCHNTRCCNPEHLLIGSHGDNWADSQHIHHERAVARRSRWVIQNVQYQTMREAQKATGISTGAINKHTINGVFDEVAYRKACKKSNCIPKI